MEEPIENNKGKELKLASVEELNSRNSAAHFLVAELHIFYFVRHTNPASMMEKCELEKKKPIAAFKGRSSSFFTTVHVVFTILLFVAMTHVQMQMNNHIAQQERENDELRQLLRNHQCLNIIRGGHKEEQNKDFEIEEQNKRQYDMKSKVRPLLEYRQYDNKEAILKCKAKFFL